MKLYHKAAAAGLIAGLAIVAATAGAQPANPERGAVLKTVEAFFAAMQARDPAAIAALVQPGAQFTQIGPGPGGPEQESVEAFLPQARHAPEAWLERVWSPEVRVDGRLAMVWSRYDFHRGARFSHNGRDLYVLARTAHGWKIVSLVFTVEPGERTEDPAGELR
ncbi:MAG TPA: nuclear transport factor 2 family protein [Caulobacteraceae bacterium]|jgi:ketosteroid isomerase-like protein|nr:nuclear transport factor 2 family protein [Caulobacteraceae bacterium]